MVVAVRTNSAQAPLGRGERRFADGEGRPNGAVLAQRDGDGARVGADQGGDALLVEPRPSDCLLK